MLQYLSVARGVLVTVTSLLTAQAAANEKLTIVYTNHSAATQPFAQAVKKGFDDACGRIQASCQMIFTQDEGSLTQQIANQQAALARNVDAMLTPLIDDNAYLANLRQARAKGVTVIAVNIDTTSAAQLALRDAYVGQDLVSAGRTLASVLAAQFPKVGPIRAVIGVNAPGQNWSEARAKGIRMGLEEFRKANPSRALVIDRVDTGTDGAIVADRIGAYVAAHRDTTAYFDTGLWHSYVAQGFQSRGIPPGKILLGGFDVVPLVLQMMKAGYIQTAIDQQPYAQGFLPVMQVYLKKKFGIHPANIDTGSAAVTPDQAGALMGLSRQGVR